MRKFAFIIAELPPVFYALFSELNKDRDTRLRQEITRRRVNSRVKTEGKVEKQQKKNKNTHKLLRAAGPRTLQRLIPPQRLTHRC